MESTKTAIEKNKAPEAQETGKLKTDYKLLCRKYGIPLITGVFGFIIAFTLLSSRLVTSPEETVTYKAKGEGLPSACGANAKCGGFFPTCVNGQCCLFLCKDHCCSFEEFYQYDNTNNINPQTPFMARITGLTELAVNQKATYNIVFEKPTDPGIKLIRVYYVPEERRNTGYIGDFRNGVPGQVFANCFVDVPLYQDAVQYSATRKIYPAMIANNSCSVELPGLQTGYYYLWFDAETKDQNPKYCISHPGCSWQYGLNKITGAPACTPESEYSAPVPVDCSKYDPLEDLWSCGFMGNGEDCGAYDYLRIKVGNPSEPVVPILTVAPTATPTPAVTVCNYGRFTKNKCKNLPFCPGGVKCASKLLIGAKTTKCITRMGSLDVVNSCCAVRQKIDATGTKCVNL